MKTKALISLLMMIVSLLAMSAVIIGAQDSTPRVWLSPETYQAQPGEEFTITININDALGVYGGSFKLSYDPQALEIVLNDNHVVTAGALFQEGPNFTLKNSVNAQEGVIEYAVTLTQPAQPVTGSGILGSVTFRALTEASGTITPTEARLLSPEFIEVDGRQIAQNIHEVEATLQGMSLTILQDAPNVAAIQPQAVPQPVVVTTNSEEPAIVLTRSDVLLLAAAGMFFIAALGLFAVTIGMYTRMNIGARRRLEQYL